MSEESGARVSATLGNLEVEAVGEDVDEAEEVFERVWERRLEETEEYAEAVKALTRGFQ